MARSDADMAGRHCGTHWAIVGFIPLLFGGSCLVAGLGGIETAKSAECEGIETEVEGRRRCLKPKDIFYDKFD